MTNPDYGYDYDTEKVKILYTLGLYELESVSMGQSNTSICLKGIKKMFNSVQFSFYNEHGEEINIFKMPEFNPYITK